MVLPGGQSEGGRLARLGDCQSDDGEEARGDAQRGCGAWLLLASNRGQMPTPRSAPPCEIPKTRPGVLRILAHLVTLKVLC